MAKPITLTHGLWAKQAGSLTHPIFFKKGFFIATITIFLSVQLWIYTTHILHTHTTRTYTHVRPYTRKEEIGGSPHTTTERVRMRVS